ncbi:hypothetical protein [Streptomyces sp. G-G2]|uniref:hypothetical protein n=1 Tax=Streptomyces sp. G-G2 TaxID=3046201 RepID=UPI0024B90AFA|nr:hypothetical protein [Streptomyces sp. G-G2]MDJ0380446.1 hypothetical protein [Streptomyces sp. G-G2]
MNPAHTHTPRPLTEADERRAARAAIAAHAVSPAELLCFLDILGLQPERDHERYREGAGDALMGFNGP